VPAAPAAPAEEPVPATKPTFDPAEEVSEPPAEEARRVRRTPVIQQASQIRPRSSRSTSVAPAPSAAPKSTKTIEELLRDLQ
jgi:hypothetical protein